MEKVGLLAGIGNLPVAFMRAAQQSGHAVVVIAVVPDVAPELAEEGLARELVSKVQQMRKQNDYEMMDKIHIYLSADDDVAKAVKDYREYIMKETLAESIENKEGLEEVDLNGHKTGLAVERI